MLVQLVHFKIIEPQRSICTYFMSIFAISISYWKII